MREQYGVLFPRFWEGTTGRALQERGREAVLLAVYLASCRHANMIGLYELPLVIVERELTVLKSRASIMKAFAEIEDVSYAAFDTATEYVWVREMARIRLNLQPGEAMKAGDHKHKAVLRLYSGLKPNPFLGPFYERYGDILRIHQGRIGPPRGSAMQEASRGFTPSEAAPNGLRGACKPCHVHVQNQVQVPEPRSVPEPESAAASPRLQPVEISNDPTDNVEVITALVSMDVIPMLGLSASYADLKEETKTLCARRKIAYSGDVIRKAIDSALYRARRTG